MTTQYLTVNEAAQHFKVHANTIYNLVQDGMPVTRIRGAIRIDLNVVTPWLEQRQSAAAAGE